MPDPHDRTLTTSDGCAIGYTLLASAPEGAPRIALIHSLALDRSFWNGVVAELRAHAHLLTYDCRGHGRSSRETTTYTAHLFARDLAELFDEVGWTSAVVAGCSMGGCVAQAFAADYPARTQAVCLIDTTAWYGPEGPRQWRERAATARDRGLGALVEFQTTRWFGDEFRARHPDLVGALVRVFLSNDIGCYQATCEMLGDDDLRALARELRMPAAIVVGEDDHATPVTMARWLHQAVAHSTLTVIPGARHLTPVERPREIAAVIRELAQTSR